MMVEPPFPTFLDHLVDAKPVTRASRISFPRSSAGRWLANRKFEETVLPDVDAIGIGVRKPVEVTENASRHTGYPGIARVSIEGRHHRNNVRATGKEHQSRIALRAVERPRFFRHRNFQFRIAAPACNLASSQNDSTGPVSFAQRVMVECSARIELIWEENAWISAAVCEC